MPPHKLLFYSDLFVIDLSLVRPLFTRERSFAGLGPAICGIHSPSTHSPKMKRPISSPSCFTSFGSAEARKGFLLFLLRFDALLEQFDQNAIIAETTLLSDALDLFGEARENRGPAGTPPAGCLGPSRKGRAQG
jgi:hypothetical protein